MKSQNYTILENFVSQLYPHEKDDTVVTISEVFNRVTRVESAPVPEKDKDRTITLKEDTDKKISAKSIKIPNLQELNLRDLAEIVVDGTAIVWIEDTRIKIAYGVVKLLFKFHSKMEYKFNEQDSRLLLCIFNLQPNSFTATEVVDEYQEKYDESLPAENLNASMDLFEKLKVLERVSPGTYRLEEKIDKRSR